MVQPRKERAMFVGLTDERINVLFEWQLDTNSNRTLRSFGVDRMCSFVCCLHQTRATATDDIATHLRQFCGEFLHRVVRGCGGLESSRSEDSDTVVLSRCATETRQFINDVP